MTVLRHNPWQLFITNVMFYCHEQNFKQLFTVIITGGLTNSPGHLYKNALTFRWTLMILNLSRVRRNINRKVYNDRKNVSATPYLRPDIRSRPSQGDNSRRHYIISVHLFLRYLNTSQVYTFIIFYRIFSHITNKYALVYGQVYF